jgi:hypothetical protein
MRTGALAVVVAASVLLSACSGSESSQPSTTTPSSSGAIAGSSPSSTSASPPPTSGGQSCGPPDLRVLSPADGTRVRAPFPVRYEVKCFEFGQDGTIYVSVDGMRFDLHPAEPTGTVTVPDHPLLSGRRTVTIQLARPGGQALANPEATVALNITIEGRR